MHREFLEAAARQPDAGVVRARLERLAEAGAALEAPELAATLIPVLANSGFLTRFLVRHPEEVELLADAEALRAPLTDSTLLAWYGDPEDEGQVASALRRTKYRAFLRITARDVALHVPVPSICADLSRVAEVAIDRAVEAARRLVAQRQAEALGPDGAPLRYVVLGMGKLGGRELNYSSDIDLVYLYDRDEGHAGRSTPHEHFTRVSELVTRLLGEVTEDGFVFRVDLRLRPEGQSGPLCNSLAAAERYYESWGRPWERLAWLRARPVGGDRALGAEVLARLAPWVYRRTIGEETLHAIAELKNRVQQRRQAAVALGRAAGVDLKLDRGGIRAVEFFANALQLLYAGRDPSLRDASTLGALQRLYATGRITDGDHDRLASAYLLYRRVEHRLQMEDERQTQRLPSGPALDALARRLHFSDPEPGRALQRLLDEHRAVVGSMFDDLLTVGDAPDAAASIAPEARLLLAPETPRAERLELFRGLGLADPDQALRLLETAGRHPTSPLSPHAPARLGDLGQRLLTDVLRSAAPERALTHLVAFIALTRGRLIDFETLHARPATARLLVSVFADSDFLSDTLLREPDLLDDLYARAPRPADLHDALAQATARARDLEAWTEALAAFKQRETLRIGLADLAGELDSAAVESALTRLAEAILAAVVDQATRRLSERHARPERGRFCVVGLGKLGGGELSYGSDLDVVFLHDDAEAPEWFTRLAQRTISLLGLPTRAGALYAVDARLRPAGTQGTLVSHVDAYAHWHLHRAGAWERMALVRARAVAGDPALCARVAETLARLTWDRPAPPGLWAEMGHLRRRIEVEVAREGPGRYNPKSGRGGLVDIEFIAQALQLRHGGDRPALRTPNTVAALLALRDQGLLKDADVLIEAHRFLRRLDHRLRIARGQPVAELRTDRPSLDRLARRLGYRRDPLAPEGADPGDQLLKDYVRCTDRVREQFERRFDADTGAEHGHRR